MSPTWVSPKGGCIEKVSNKTIILSQSIGLAYGKDVAIDDRSQYFNPINDMHGCASQVIGRNVNFGKNLYGQINLLKYNERP